MSRVGVSLSVSATLHEVHGQELVELLDTVLAGEVVADRDVAERLVRSIGALVHLHQRHRLDTHGRCTVCWPRRWWFHGHRNDPPAPYRRH